MKKYYVQMIIEVYDEEAPKSDVEFEICEKLDRGCVGTVESIQVEEQV